MSDIKINVVPRELGEVGHDMGGTGADIPMLAIADGVEVIFYGFLLDPGQQSAWLADLAAHALELAALIDAQAANADEVAS